MKTIVGCSVNPEIMVRYDPKSPHPKVPATDVRYNLAGTSANVARALNRLGQESVLLATLGTDGDDEVGRMVLDMLLKLSGLQYVALQVRDRTNLSFLPLPTDGSQTKVIGFKGRIFQEKLPEAAELIRSTTASSNGGFRVATGVRPEEIPLVKALFEGGEGKRVLNPDIRLMAKPAVAEELLRLSDCLVCNEAEFDELFSGNRHLQFQRIHQLGPSLVLVTKSHEGAIFSHRLCEGRVNAVGVGEVVSEVGAGDWWHAGFLTRLMEQGAHDFTDLTFEQVSEAAHFASVVAGIKVTLPGANNGPDRQMVEEYLASAR